MSLDRLRNYVDRIQVVPYKTQKEILLRAALLTVVSVIHIHVEPYIQEITETDMTNYKRPRKESMIPVWVLLILLFCVPLVVLSLPSIEAGIQNLSPPLLAWSLACAINAVITLSGKLIVGRPRPDYFYRCYPDGKVPQDLRCTGLAKDVMEGRKSFPSGHSSFSFCSLGFISIWLCGELRVLSTNRGEGLRVVACLVPLVVAGVLALSRYCDNHHHWEDVFAGSIIGCLSSYFCYRQYYHALDSPNAGCPYVTRSPEVFPNGNGGSREVCCTRNLLRQFSGHVINKYK